MKNIFLMRHAEPTKLINDDSKRGLTENGKSYVFNLATNNLELLKNLDYILCSPYKRTFQTAEIIKIITEHKNDLILDNRLLPGCKPEYIEEIANCLDEDNVLFVAHNPELSYHVSYFTGNPEPIVFGYATLVQISFENKIAPMSGKVKLLIQT